MCVIDEPEKYIFYSVSIDFTLCNYNRALLTCALITDNFMSVVFFYFKNNLCAALMKIMLCCVMLFI